VWFQEAENPELDNLMDQVAQFYSEKIDNGAFAIQPENVFVGMKVAAFVLDTWESSTTTE